MSFDDWMTKRLSIPEESPAGGGVHLAKEPRTQYEIYRDAGVKGKSTALKNRVLPAEKICRGCGTVKESDNFALKNNNKDGLDTRCKACESIRKRAAYHAKKEALSGSLSVKPSYSIAPANLKAAKWDGEKPRFVNRASI